MAKLTVRLDDEMAAVYRHFCTSAGISQQAGLEAHVRRTCEFFDSQGRRPLHEWAKEDDEEFALRWSPFVDLARAIDSEHRSRG